MGHNHVFVLANYQLLHRHYVRELLLAINDLRVFDLLFLNRDPYILALLQLKDFFCLAKRHCLLCLGRGEVHLPSSLLFVLPLLPSINYVFNNSKNEGLSDAVPLESVEFLLHQN